MLNLKYHLRSKGQNTNWTFEIRPRRVVKRKTLESEVKKLYPNLTIKRSYIVKTLKRACIVLETNQKPPWI